MYLLVFQITGLFRNSQEGRKKAKKHLHSIISKICSGSTLQDELIMVFISEA